MFTNNAPPTASTFDDRYPFVVVDIPVILTDRAGIRQRRLMPILIINVRGEITIPQEVALWATDMVAVKPSKVQHLAQATIGRLYAFWLATGSPILRTAFDVDCLIDSYLLYRVKTPHNFNERLFPLLDRVSLDTVKRELQSISSFVQSIRRHRKLDHPLSEALSVTNGVFEVRIPTKRMKSFWSHLDSQWASYQQLETQSPVFPAYLRALADWDGTVGIQQATMSAEVAEAIIENTLEVSYTALFEAAYGTGGRASEYLHMFRCDVQPNSMSRHFMRIDTDDPLLIFAHPTRSTWNGIIDPISRTSDRARFIRKEYGIAPRYKHPNKKYALGWKGMKFFDRRLLRIPVWLNPERAHRFEALAAELRSVCLSEGTHREHPYLFVGTSYRSNRGQPLKYANVEKAFNAAARRAGVFGMPGVTFHGFRHHYVWHLRNVWKLPKHLIAVAVGHESLDSSDDYGLDLEMVFNAAKARSAANAG
jgi:hypothetical protein